MSETLLIEEQMPETNNLLEDKKLLKALGKTSVATDILEISTESLTVLRDENGELITVGQSNNCHAPQCMSSKSMNSQSCTRCSHGCHPPRRSPVAGPVVNPS